MDGIALRPNHIIKRPLSLANQDFVGRWSSGIYVV
jgi:hypothetical protein